VHTVSCSLLLSQATHLAAVVLAQRVKPVWGPDGTGNDVDVASGKPMPIQLRGSDGTDRSNLLPVSNTVGLSASVWSNDLSAVHRIVPRLKAGTVWVNAHGVLDTNLPFGGYKQSGFGRDLGRAAVESYTESKSVCMSV